MEELLKYFPNLSPLQIERFTALGQLYPEWNEKINVISRKDIDNLYSHHILHSLAIAKFITPIDGTQMIDLGTGGGFPGIPLAIFWPECRFHLIDRIGKKIKVAAAIAEELGLDNVSFQHGDMGECKLKADYIVSRAVMQLDELVKICARNVAGQSRNKLPNGLICLKGGELASELGRVKRPLIDVPLSDYFSEEYFKTKDLIYVKI
ncbi:MAG: 16S rRNA (guanine(527)-N(7))-methyltransferase RsmG [Duncaniella sp.]|uniref:16S rRNA (guanine(527)-N(7))-methyltransferase RsmG n=1 Tax=Duncaniella sp. TaxID=2518496 RepID=UPI0019886AD9|nr:16S rRNA (guanine(527)-N(7))-methyltransferase RsmG [Duncaniella sp.]MBD5314252.1 16S rRNA (guanine(527)-N(7))-methyltransferase RsmG [Bacteroides sp.]MDE6090915.1 16S rRNA (guanine(527)-N(7))-methyltransferase RsmG [Duncaniella sp.]